MPQLLSHLEIGSSCGGCMTELLSTCRVLNNLAEVGCCANPEARGCAGYWKISDCDDCCCPQLDPGGGIADAPWHDPTVPASADFLGLHGSLELASPPNQTTVSSDGSTTAAIPKQLTFIGAIISKSAEGTVFGEQWIERQLLPDCPACDGRPVRFYMFCQDSAPADVPPVGQQIPDPNAGWEEPCGGCGCDDLGSENIERLLDAPRPVANDNGGRDLLRVRYNPGSFSQLPTEDGTPIPYCAGKAVTFSFTVLESSQYLDPVEACRFNSEEHPIDYDRCYTDEWSTPEPDPVITGKPGCEPPPTPQITTENQHFETLAEDYTLACRWSAPLATHRIACLTPFFAGDEADVIIRFNPGDKDACNVAITMWEAAIGWPHPANPAGRQVYPIASAVSRAEISWVPSGETITLDGRTSVTTPGVTGCSGGVYRQSSVPCGRRYWVALDIDCMSPPGEGWSFEVDLAPKQRIVG